MTDYAREVLISAKQQLTVSIERQAKHIADAQESLKRAQDDLAITQANLDDINKELGIEP